MPSAPQIIAALLLGISLGHFSWAVTKGVRYAVRTYGWKLAGKPAAEAVGQVFVNLCTSLLWIALLAWGGFWS